jgi:hypothetical protein
VSDCPRLTSSKIYFHGPLFPANLIPPLELVEGFRMPLRACARVTRLTLACSTSFLERKIGCDKALPSCNNCARTGRNCMGYGLRLVWPDIPDGRRKLPKLPAQKASKQLQAAGTYYGQQFLNFSFDDVEQHRQDVSILTLHTHHARPHPSLTLLPDMPGIESELLCYCGLLPFPSCLCPRSDLA